MRERETEKGMNLRMEMLEIGPRQTILNFDDSGRRMFVQEQLTCYHRSPKTNNTCVFCKCAPPLATTNLLHYNLHNRTLSVNIKHDLNNWQSTNTLIS